MNKKLYALLLPVIAVAAMAMTATAAQAQPHWFVCKSVKASEGKFSDSECEIEKKEGGFAWVKLPETSEGEATQVITFGKLTLKVPALGIALQCKVLDAGNIWNPIGGGAGLDVILLFTNYECKVVEGTCPTPEITANGFPWLTKLVAGTPVKDEITGIKIKVFCNKEEKGEFTGELKPVLGHAAGKPHYFEFTSATGKLKDGPVEAEVIGKDYVETDEGEEVKAE